jgi:hypothetical protein
MHPAQYLPIQQALRAKSFDISDIPASERAVEALLRFMDRRGLQAQLRQNLAA